MPEMTDEQIDTCLRITMEEFDRVKQECDLTPEQKEMLFKCVHIDFGPHPNEGFLITLLDGFTIKVKQQHVQVIGRDIKIHLRVAINKIANVMFRGV